MDRLILDKANKLDVYIRDLRDTLEGLHTKVENSSNYKIIIVFDEGDVSSRITLPSLLYKDVIRYSKIEIRSEIEKSESEFKNL